MGSYVYKVTSKIKTLRDGTKANIAIFAYKPTYAWGNEADKLNRSWHKKSGCYAAETYVKNSKNYTGKVVMGEEGLEAIECNQGSFYDDWFAYRLNNANV